MGPATGLTALAADWRSTLSSFFASISAPVVRVAQAAGLPLGAIAVGITLGVIVYWVLFRLQVGARVDRAGTVQVRVVGAPGPGEWAESPPASVRPEVWAEDEPDSAPAPVRLVATYPSKGPRYTLPMTGPGVHPTTPLPRARGFLYTLALTFVAAAALLLAFYARIFGVYDHLVALVGTFLYWPIKWPGVYAVGPSVLAVPDYIFPMYLAGMVAFSIALGLVTDTPHRTRQRRALALVVVLGYAMTELLLDALFFTIPGASFRDFAILVRAMTGGFFLALLVSTGLHLPRAQRIVPKFPRDTSAVPIFLGFGLLAIAVAAVILVAIPPVLHLGGLLVTFTLLLLLPTLTLEFFGLVAGPYYFRRIRRRSHPSLKNYHPGVSIVIPCYNEQLWIAETIRSADVAAAMYPGPVEIIVGNDGSTDRTLELARDAITKLEHCSGVVLDLPHGGKSNALNGALAVAKMEIVLRLDGDTKIDERYGFAEMIRHFADPEVGGVQGAIHPRQTSGWTRKLRALEVAWNHYLLRPAGMGTRSAEVIDGLFSAFRREDLVRLGGWVPWNGEDTEIAIRIQRLGYRLRIEFGSRALEDVPENYVALRKQRVRWARGILMANGQHYPALVGNTPEFGGLAVLFWFLLFVRSGLRSLVYVFLIVLILVLGVPALLYAAALFLIAMGFRAVPIAYYLAKMGRSDVIPWIPFFPIGNVIKQSFRLEAFGTLGPQAMGEYV
jgi:cellulose synthase/poly-beta-1,6-N-acetylglucosamine synthase-like glycosyltransferase